VLPKTMTPHAMTWWKTYRHMLLTKNNMVLPVLIQTVIDVSESSQKLLDMLTTFYILCLNNYRFVFVICNSCDS